MLSLSTAGMCGTPESAVDATIVGLRVGVSLRLREVSDLRRHEVACDPCSLPLLEDGARS